MGQLFGKAASTAGSTTGSATGAASGGAASSATGAASGGAASKATGAGSGGGGAGGILKMVGAGLAAYAQVQEGDIANAVGMYNQGVARAQAKEIEAKAAFDQTRQAEEGARVMSTMEAGGAAAGGGMNLLALAKQRSELELQNLMIGREGAIGAGQARAEGAMARWQGKTAQKQGYLKAGATLLGGFA